MAVAGCTAVLHRKLNPRTVAIRAVFVRGLDKNLTAAVANLAGGAGVELAKGIFPCPLAKGTGPIFGLGRKIILVFIRGHFVLQGGSAAPSTSRNPPSLEGRELEGGWCHPLPDPLPSREREVEDAGNSP